MSLTSCHFFIKYLSFFRPEVLPKFSHLLLEVGLLNVTGDLRCPHKEILPSYCPSWVSFILDNEPLQVVCVVTLEVFWKSTVLLSLLLYTITLPAIIAFSAVQSFARILIHNACFVRLHLNNIRIFHKPCTIQECQHCQLCFSSANKSQLVQWSV